jgi:hypothetical protein
MELSRTDLQTENTPFPKIASQSDAIQYAGAKTTALVSVIVTTMRFFVSRVRMMVRVFHRMPLR